MDAPRDPQFGEACIEASKTEPIEAVAKLEVCGQHRPEFIDNLVAVSFQSYDNPGPDSFSGEFQLSAPLARELGLRLIEEASEADKDERMT